ncbi:MAG: hypothetical protein COA76_01605 [Moritella sp.]|nr:MAG: hypothetical protein COA76_01605 [Moritella sp.]
MKLLPYKYIADFTLEIGEIDLVKISGSPSRKETNAVGLLELDYGSKVYRFDQVGDLNELTIKCEAVEVEGVVIPFAHLQGYITEVDGGAFDKYGFCVSPLLGVAFDPEHKPWLTVLTKKGLGSWSKV